MIIKRLSHFLLCCIGFTFATQTSFYYTRLQVPDDIPLSGNLDLEFKFRALPTQIDTVYFKIYRLEGDIEVITSLDSTFLNPNGDTLVFPITVSISDNDTNLICITAGKFPVAGGGCYSFVTTGDTTEFFRTDIKQLTNMQKKMAKYRDANHPSRSSHGTRYPVELPGYTPGMYDTQTPSVDSTGTRKSLTEVMEEKYPSPEEKIRYLKEIGALEMLRGVLSQSEYHEFKTNYFMSLQKNDGIDRYSQPRVTQCEDCRQLRRPSGSLQKSLRLYGLQQHRMDTVELINEGFEENIFPPNGWEINNYETSGNQWGRSDDLVYQDNSSACVGFDVNNFIMTELFTPIFDLSDPSYKSAFLSFYRYSEFSSDYHYHEIAIYVDDEPHSYIELDYRNYGDWYFEAIDLSSFIGKDNVKIGIYYEGQDTDSWYIDNLIVEVLTDLSRKN